jgi:hypothetical protein
MPWYGCAVMITMACKIVFKISLASLVTGIHGGKRVTGESLVIRLQPSAQVASVCVLIRMMTLGTQLHLVPPRVSRSSYVTSPHPHDPA